MAKKESLPRWKKKEKKGNISFYFTDVEVRFRYQGAFGYMKQRRAGLGLAIPFHVAPIGLEGVSENPSLQCFSPFPKFQSFALWFRASSHFGIL